MASESSSSSSATSSCCTGVAGKFGVACTFPIRSCRISPSTLSTSPSASSSSSSIASGIISPTISSIMPAFTNSCDSSLIVPINSGNLTKLLTSFMMPVEALMLPSIFLTANASLTCIATLLSCALEVTRRLVVLRARMSSRAKTRVSCAACFACEGLRCARFEAAMMRARVLFSTALRDAMSRSSLRTFCRMSWLHLRTWEDKKMVSYMRCCEPGLAEN
ncbi:hypothetical protein ACMFMG_012247 [Clarireedia jacksonii]